MPMRRGRKKNVAKNGKRNQKQQEVRNHLGLKQNQNEEHPHHPSKRNQNQKPKPQ
jgi:hypothetical protein